MAPDDQLAPVETFTVDPTASAGRRRTMKIETMIALGQHPMGGPCRPAAGTCGNCANLRRVEYHRSHYLKCALTRWTHGAGTDVRRRWPACDRWASLAPPPPVIVTPPEPDPLAPALVTGNAPDLEPTLGSNHI